MSTTPSKSHTGRNAAIIILVLLFILVGLPLFFVWMLLPSKAQLHRLDESLHQVYESQNSYNSELIIIEEPLLDFLMNRSISEVWEKSGDVQFAGTDLVLEEDRLRLLFAVSTIMPWNREKPVPKQTSFALEAFLDIYKEEPDILHIKLDKIKIGKLGIPVATLMKLQFMKDSLTNSVSVLPGMTKVDIQKQSASIRLNEFSNEMFPGSTLDEFEIMPGEFRFLLSLPDDQIQSIEGLIASLYKYIPDLLSTLEPMIPAESTAELKNSEVILAGIASGDVQNPVSGLYTVLRRTVNFWLTLSPEEQDQVMEASIQFLEKNPEAIEELEDFLEAHGGKTEHIKS